MKVIHVIPSLDPATGGPLQYVLGLAGAQARLPDGPEVELWSTNLDLERRVAAPTDRIAEPAGVTLRVFPAGAPRRWYRSPAMADAWRREDPAGLLLHLHAIWVDPSRRLARLAREAGRPPVVRPCGSLSPEMRRRGLSWAKRCSLALFEGPMLRAASRVHVTSAAEREAAEAVVPGIRPWVLPGGVSPDLPDRPRTDRTAWEARGIPPERRVIVSLGRIHPVKAYDRLIEAVAPMDAHVVLIGPHEGSHAATLQALARDLGCADRLHLAGPVYGTDRLDLVSAADLFCLPSHHENFGLAALEAMAVGTPVVLSPEVGLAEAVRETVTVSPSDPAQLRPALEALLEDPDLRSRRSEQGRTVVRDRYTWPAVARASVRAYTELAAEMRG